VREMRDVMWRILAKRVIIKALPPVATNSREG
jgi:hypothetical protein